MMLTHEFSSCNALWQQAKAILQGLRQTPERIVVHFNHSAVRHTA